jgi:hypothetical protein
VKKTILITPHYLIKFLPFFFAIVLVQSCDKAGTDPIDSHEYYPLELGRYQIYQVQETIYSAGQTKPVITTWQEKDEVDRISSTNENVVTYIIARYKRNLATDYWQKTKEYAVTKSPDKILTNMDNQTVFSLVFPIDAKLKWNGNLYNALDAQDYQYQDINKPATIDKLTFDKTLTVQERKDTSVINRFVGLKKYALGTGLILDEQTSYEYCQDDDCIGDYIIESGSYKTRRILESGSLK